jgi:hypothetical protein
VPSTSCPANRKSQTSSVACIGGVVLPQPLHEVAEGCEVSHELLNVLDVPSLAYLSDGQNLVEVHLDAMLDDDVP